MQPRHNSGSPSVPLVPSPPCSRIGNHKSEWQYVHRPMLCPLSALPSPEKGQQPGTLLANVSEVRRQGGRVVRGRPTAHVAPPPFVSNVRAAQRSPPGQGSGGGASIGGSSAGFRLPPVGAIPALRATGNPNSSSGRVVPPPPNYPAPGPPSGASLYLAKMR